MTLYYNATYEYYNAELLIIVFRILLIHCSDFNNNNIMAYAYFQ